MTRTIGDTVLIETEESDDCAYCGAHAELRPYGAHGARICFDCAIKPENKTTTSRMYAELLGGKVQ